MKRILSFLRSMKFGLALLILVIVCSFAGSLIAQGREAVWYTQTFPKAGRLILALGADNLFQTWYFIALVGLLCLCLTLCSITRFDNVHKMRKNALRAAEKSAEELQESTIIGTEAADGLRKFLAGKRYRKHETQDAIIFYKNMTGYYGPFVVHLSLLLILIFGGLVLSLSDAEDYSVMPGEKLILGDGTTLELDSFRMTDETGRIDYASIIHVTSPNGTDSVRREISVNRPLTFHSFKYYQYSYGTAGSVTAIDGAGREDVFYLTERSFLSGDGKNGVWFEALFPGHVLDDDGHIIPLVSRDTTHYPNPVYQVLVANRGDMSPMMVLPGDTVQAGDISFTFNEPAWYPGIRIKYIPNPFPAILYASFVLMMVGFWLNFFHTPDAAVVRRDSYVVTNMKSSGLQFEIDALLSKYKEMHTQ